MLTIQGRKFARNDAEFTSSLFDPSGTCAGYYKQVPAGVRLLDMQKRIFAFIKYNGFDPFAVSASPEGKRTRYMYGMTDGDEKTLGLSGLRYMEKSAAIRQAVESLSVSPANPI